MIQPLITEEYTGPTLCDAEFNSHTDSGAVGYSLIMYHSWSMPLQYFAGDHQASDTGTFTSNHPIVAVTEAGTAAPLLIPMPVEGRYQKGLAPSIFGVDLIALFLYHRNIISLVTQQVRNLHLLRW